MNRLKIFTIMLLSWFSLSLSAKEFRASFFGIKSDGTTLNTGSIQKAIDYISENGGGKLIFYVGRYLTGTIQLRSNVVLQLEEGAILVASTSVYDYTGTNGTKALITAEGLQNIAISGKGVIEGRGAKVLEQIHQQMQKGFLRESEIQASPALIAMNNCINITIGQLNLVHACGNVLSFTDCRDLLISDLLVNSTAVKESNGITLSGCERVVLSNLYLETSGKEVFTDSTSSKLTVINCRNKAGKLTVPLTGL